MQLPSKTLNDMRDLMPLYNKLTDVVARDSAWLRETLREYVFREVQNSVRLRPTSTFCAQNCSRRRVYE